MIVFALVFLILLVPRLVHGDQAPLHHSSGNQPPGGLPLTSWQLPPLSQVTNGLLPPNHVQEEPGHTNTGLTNANQPPPEPTGVPYSRFVDFTDHFKDDFADHRLGGRLGLHRFVLLPPESTFITTNAIAVTPQEYLVLLPKNTIVVISDNPNKVIRVPADKSIRVVRVSSQEMMRIWGMCSTFYSREWRAIRARGKRPELSSRYLLRCFHYNLWYVGYDFVPANVREYDISTITRARGRRQRRG